MLTPERFLRLMIELIFVMLGVLFLLLGLARRIYVDRHSTAWLILSVALVLWGLRALYLCGPNAGGPGRCARAARDRRLRSGLPAPVNSTRRDLHRHSSALSSQFASDIIRPTDGPSDRRVFRPGPLLASPKEKRRKPVLKEFKEFAMRGSVVDLAVGVIIGAAFGKIVSSLVEDVIMPPIGRLLGHVDFSGLFINLGDKSYETLAAAKAAGAPTLNYGFFLNTVINFLIIAFAVFLVVQQVNRWTRKPAAAAASTTKDCPQCAMPIPIAAKRCGHSTTQLARSSGQRSVPNSKREQPQAVRRDKQRPGKH